MTHIPQHPGPDRPALPASDTGTPRPHRPALTVDLDAVTARYRAIVTNPTTGLRALVRSIAEIPALVSEVDRLYTLLVDARRRYADLAAAARATLAAHADGEPDPLAYLRDELGHPSDASGQPGRGR